MRFKLVAYVA